MGFLCPVPSVVCVLVIKAMRICMFDPVKDQISLFRWTEKIRLLKTILQPSIVLTSKKILRWNMTKEDEC
jgi:hypothetical protein